MAGDRSGRRPGRPETRAQILQAARTLFAQHGYTGVTVRAVADAADVDPALVHHYFGTKEGLFRAALDVPLDPEQVVAKVASAGPDGAATQLLQIFLDAWDSAETGPAMAAFLRTMLAETATDQSLRDFLEVAVVGRAAAGLLPELDHDAARLRIGLALSQMVGLAVVRRLIRLEPIASMPSEQLIEVVAPTIARYLHEER